MKVLFNFFDTYKDITGKDKPDVQYCDVLRSLKDILGYSIDVINRDDNAPALWIILDTEIGEQEQWWYYSNDFSCYEEQRDELSWDTEFPLHVLMEKILNKDSSIDFVGCIC